MRGFEKIWVEEYGPGCGGVQGTVRPGAYIIESSLLVIHISAVAQGVMGSKGTCKCASGGQDVALCVIGILDNRSAAGIQDGSNVTLQVGGIVVVRAVVGNRHGSAGCVIGKVQGIAAHGHLAQAAAVVDVVIGSGTVGSLGSQAVRIVGVRPGGAAIGHGRQLTAMLPGIGPCAVGQHIANGVTGNGLAVVAGQQITPGTIIGIVDSALHRTQRTGGVGILLAAGDVACVVIGPDICLTFS